jgi:Tfp pilus assembly pilus retraction ATPase PilT
MDLELVLRRAVELGASDIHLKVERPPVVRRDDLGPLEGEPDLTERDLELALEQVAPRRRSLQTFLETESSTARSRPRACRGSASKATGSAARSRWRSASFPARCPISATCRSRPV